MKFNFKIQQYQTEAVASVVNVFRRQPGPLLADESAAEDAAEGRNVPVALSDSALLANIREIQKNNQIQLSRQLVRHLGRCSLDVEMETGTGKTYVYSKTMYELDKQYGWSKFIIVVPSVAVREGVKKSFEITQDHFMEQYGRKIRFFVYDSRRLDQLDAFTANSGITVMIINMQAFNTAMKKGARSREARIIYDKRDGFGSRRPIDVIRAVRPILILDEPQKMGGDATQKALQNFDPLFCLNYSATHKECHNLVYVLDAVDAYNQKLVKKIEVKGFQIKNLRGIDTYLYLESILVSPKRPPRVRMELEIKYEKSVNREKRILGVDDSLYQVSKNMEQYRGFRIAEIDPLAGSVTFTNGEVIHKGEVMGDASEKDMRRLQIRETILSHMEKEEELFERGIKTLSLYFIDEVAKYRMYDEQGRQQLGEYGRIFEEEYRDIVREYLTDADTPYQRYLRAIAAEETHQGYFCIDKKGRAVDSRAQRGSDLSDDSSAYDLILKDKEKLLSFQEPVRFIFSHSALREGWDNPNVFQICTLKHGESTTMKRQEVGRGLRLCVDQAGLRMDEQTLGKDLVHRVNKLTVIASESYKEFAADLQKQMKAVLYDRPVGDSGEIQGIFNEKMLEEMIGNGRETILVENKLNENFARKEFQSLWKQINHKYAYTVAFDSRVLIQRAIEQIDRELFVSRLQYTVSLSEQQEVMDAGMIREGRSFTEIRIGTAAFGYTKGSPLKYDLVGRIAEGAGLTRKTAAAILQGISPRRFAMFQENPEEFITKVVRLIKEQKASTIVDNITYKQLEECYDDSVFTTEKRISLEKAYRGRKHIQDYVLTDGTAEKSVERRFAEALERAEEVCVYAKLPKGYAIPTPVGRYSPDWAISFYEGTVKHIYFLAETKGTMDSPKLREIERARILCARKLFNEMSDKDVVYHDVDSYQSLLDVMDSIEK